MIMKFRVEKFRRKRLKFWKPDSGEYKVIINLAQTPRIREQNFSDGSSKKFADFVVEVNGERYWWAIPIARVENGVIYFWEKSQRGRALIEIGEAFGYNVHKLKVVVIRSENRLDTRYSIKHAEDCPCLSDKR